MAAKAAVVFNTGMTRMTEMSRVRVCVSTRASPHPPGGPARTAGIGAPMGGAIGKRGESLHPICAHRVAPDGSLLDVVDGGKWY